MQKSILREPRSAFRRPTNVSLDAKLVEAAKELAINISRACEEGLAKQIKTERERRWIEENREAIDGSNAYFVKHGLPLAKYRMF